MAKQYEVAFKLAASMSGQFSKSFKTAGGLLSSVKDRISILNAEAGRIDGLVKARKAVAESSRAYAQAARKVGDLGREIAAAQQPTREQTAAFVRAKKVLERTKTELQRSRGALKELNKEENAGTVSLSTLAQRHDELRKAIERSSQAQKQLNRLQAEYEKANQFQGRIEALNDRTEAVAGFLKTASKVTVVAASSAGAALVKTGADYQQAMNHLQAATGLTAEEMHNLEETARGLYASGLGESFSEVAGAMAAVRQTSGLAGESLENATRSAMVLSKTFGMDVNESARAGSALMKNFGISSQEAYDLIAYAAQNGANKNGDLLDTLNEYSVQYKALGFTASQFAAHLVKGAQDGAFSIDKVGDAVKEFNIRAKDGSQSSMDAFAMLGLNGERATQMFAAGGERAQMAFAEVVKRLQEMQDPVKRNAAGVALFGTQFEDLQSGALDGFAAIQKTAVDARGTIGSIADLSNADIGSQFKIILRQIQDSVYPATKSIAVAISSRMPEIEKAVQGVMPAINAFSQAFVENIPVLTAWAFSAIHGISSAATFLIDNFGAISKAVVYVGAAFVSLRTFGVLASTMMSIYKAALLVQKGFIFVRSSMLLSAIAANAATVATKGLAVATRVLGAAFKFLLTNPVGLMLTGLVAAGVALYENWDKIKEMAGVAADYISAKWQSALSAVKGVFASTFQTLAGVMKGPINAVIAMINKMIDAINGISVSIPDWVPVVGGQTFAPNLPKIPQLAEGGVATRPTLASIAEGGEPEAVLPLSKLSNMLGSAAPGSGGGTTMTVNFAPVINVSGGSASSSDIDGALQLSERRLREMLGRVLANERRLSFA